MKHGLIVSGITFSVFFAEAIIHYNYGILETKNIPFSWDSFFEDFTFPKGKSLMKMSAIVGVAAVLSGKLISFAESRLD
jgi:vacuolar-type H+-ATPase subunit I/STV1